MDYCEITVDTTIYAEEIVSAVFLEKGSKGVIYEDSDVSGVTGDYIGELVGDGDTEAKIRAFFPAQDCERVMGEIAGKLNEIKGYGLGVDLGALSLSSRIVSEEDWANNWKKYYKPLHIGENIVVVPKWEEYKPAAGEIVLTLDPGMAFGTGQHESTNMCMVALEKYITPGARVLDLGCGSGILAIESKLLGAGETVAVDIDTNAVSIAASNAADNSADITCLAGDALTDKALRKSIGGGYDMVVANIIADVIIAFAPYIAQVLKAGGEAVFSGIISSREDDVVKSVAALFDVREITRMDEWVCVYAVKK